MVLDAVWSRTQELAGDLMSAAGVGGSHMASQAPQKDIRIKSLYVHPIKSCKSSAVSQVKYTRDGLHLDRAWLIIDAETQQFQTARQLSRMVLIDPSVDQDRGVLRIEIPLTEKGKGTVVVETPLEPTEEQLRDMELVRGITIWKSEVDGYAVSKAADEALTEFFGKPMRLVRKGPTDRKSGPDDHRQHATLNFQDFYPLTVVTQASLDHVRQTLVKSVYPSLSSSEVEELKVEIPQVKVPDSLSRETWTPEALEALSMIRFRQNIVLESVDNNDATATGPLLPFEEDGFLELEVFDKDDVAAAAAPDASQVPFGTSALGKGKVGIDCFARCARCLVTTIDPETGERDPHLPYKVLQGYRQVEPAARKIGKPCFGVLSGIREEAHRSQEGIFKVGDIVRVTKTIDPEKRVANPP